MKDKKSKLKSVSFPKRESLPENKQKLLVPLLQMASGSPMSARSGNFD